MDEATGQTNVGGATRSRKRKRRAREAAEKDTPEPASVPVADGGPVKKVKMPSPWCCISHRPGGKEGNKGWLLDIMCLMSHCSRRSGKTSRECWFSVLEE